MPLLEWIPALSVGNEAIDAQHRRLFDLINRLEAGGGPGAAADPEAPQAEAGLLEVADELARYVAEHFGDEERLFAARRYPHAHAHIEEHRAFVARILEFRPRLAGAGAGDGEAPESGREAVVAELAAYLKTWLTRHIAVSDRKYRPWLGDQSQR